MAKKKKETIVEEPIVEETVTVEEPVVEVPKVETKPKIKKEEKPKDNWEIKDRTYYLTGGKKPLSHAIRSASIYYFDEEKGYERELKYCENQRTVFVDEMKGDQRQAHIVFRNGALYVPRNKTVLQKLLSLYHPHKGSMYYEWQPAVRAENELDKIELEVEALKLASSLDINLMEAIMRVEIGSKVSKMSSSELKRDCLLFAKRNPNLFLELANDDNIQLRNFGIRAKELGVINLSSDQRHFTWGSTGRKLMTVPFDEHPYTALAAWFKTDEGMEIFSNIEKRLG